MAEAAVLPDDPRIDDILARLRQGEAVDDLAFDRVYPEEVRRLSRLHFTPVQVALRAIELLGGKSPRARILDLGSGVGKFCLIGALASRARYFGIEQRPHFVALSQAVARKYRVPRVTHLEGDLFEHDWSDYRGIYLFNPFQENRTPEQKIDSTVPLGQCRYESHVRDAEHALEGMPIGTRVVTYFGFGGKMPDSYIRVLQEFCHRGPLECWVKAR